MFYCVSPSLCLWLHKSTRPDCLNSLQNTMNSVAVQEKYKYISICWPQQIEVILIIITLIIRLRYVILSTFPHVFKFISKFNRKKETALSTFYKKTNCPNFETHKTTLMLIPKKYASVILSSTLGKSFILLLDVKSLFFLNVEENIYD